MYLLMNMPLHPSPGGTRRPCPQTCHMGLLLSTTRFSTSSLLELLGGPSAGQSLLRQISFLLVDVPYVNLVLAKGSELKLVEAGGMGWGQCQLLAHCHL